MCSASEIEIEIVCALGNREVGMDIQRAKGFVWNKVWPYEKNLMIHKETSISIAMHNMHQNIQYVS